MPQKCRPRPRPYPHKPRGIPFATRLLDSAGRFNLAVDGSVEGIEFTFVPADDLMVTEIAFTFEAKGAIAFGDRFIDGPALKRGIDIELQSYGIDVDAVFRANRDLIEYASPNGVYIANGRLAASDADRGAINGGPKLVKVVRHFSQGLALYQRHGDGIRLTVQDDLTSFPYAIASAFGYTI